MLGAIVGLCQHTYVTVEFRSGKLSITGVEGPTSNGNSLGGCGQITLDASKMNLDGDWTPAMVIKLQSVWDEYHLNDLKPYSLAMKAAGWDKLATKPIFKYEFSMTPTVGAELVALKELIIQQAVSDKQVSLNEDQKTLLTSPTYKNVYCYPDEIPILPRFMERSKDVLGKGHLFEKPPEAKNLGWILQTEHPDGLLCRELDGEGYGKKWYFHPIPEDVLDWLESLPEAMRKSPWDK